MDILHFLDREELTLATIQKRAFAMAIDSMIMIFFLIAIDYSAWSQLTTVEEVVTWSNHLTMMYMIIAFSYQTIFVFLYGASIGKMVMKIRVITLQTGGTPSLYEAMNRSVVRIISETVFGLGFLWAAFDPNRQSWHDKTAKTIVINA